MVCGSCQVPASPGIASCPPACVVGWIAEAPPRASVSVPEDPSLYDQLAFRLSPLSEVVVWVTVRSRVVSRYDHDRTLPDQDWVVIE